ncbi:toll/interleukin-1 receptor domain-containing protein [Streptomyces galilaeus]|uniref:toll/interleukin-1 receptor domain-containing protein n=1 Tax=Streptomyces galilaeus TaxID=33899 RepID=UPI00142F1EE8|nr:toll/interleukin-1 receptor domain-containing protein [Streptomyces galilaeus]GGW81831.1 hypothetical protein GCM10010350_78270 [Streptomyces galilaeus]
MSTQISQVNRLFISYAHADNKLFDDAVKSFVDDLKGFYSAKTGNDLSVFFDRESIGWGDDWRAQIDGELRNASIFMPIITMQYFNRPACRDELNAFHGTAGRLNAKYLILPVVIAGAAGIRAEHAIPEVSVIESLQYKNLESAFLAGQGTQEWRKAISDLTDELIGVIAKAESITQEPESGTATSDGSGELDEDEDFLGTMDELNGYAHTLTQQVEQALNDLNSWGEVVQASFTQVKPGITSQQLQAVSVQMAGRLKAPSSKLHDSGLQLAATAEQADVVMNSAVKQISRVQAPEARETLRNMIGSTQGSGELREVVTEITNFLALMTGVEVMSAPLRNALKPARIGITKIQDAVRIVDRWGSIA